MTNAVRKILIADDHAVVRQGLKSILAEAYPGAVFAEAENGIDVLRYLRNRDWDIVILDISMPGRSGLEVLKDIKYEHPQLPVLILSVHPEDQYAVRVLHAGAAGFLSKGSAPEELIQAVGKVLGGGKYISASVAEKLVPHLETQHARAPHEQLSDREFQVLCLLASGKTPTEIAESLALSVKTISTFRTRILTKMNMRNNAELAHYAIEHKLVG
jgi:two-component system invasion response regulator UvrY